MQHAESYGVVPGNQSREKRSLKAREVSYGVRQRSYGTTGQDLPSCGRQSTMQPHWSGLFSHSRDPVTLQLITNVGSRQDGQNTRPSYSSMAPRHPSWKTHELLGNWSAYQDFSGYPDVHLLRAHRADTGRPWHCLCARPSLMIQRCRYCHIISVVSASPEKREATGSVLGSRAEIWNQGIVQTPWPKAQLLPSVTDTGNRTMQSPSVVFLPFLLAPSSASLHLCSLPPCLLHILNIFQTRLLFLEIEH